MGEMQANRQAVRAIAEPHSRGHRGPIRSTQRAITMSICSLIASIGLIAIIFIASQANVFPAYRGAQIVEEVEPKSPMAAFAPVAIMVLLVVTSNVLSVMSDSANADILYAFTHGHLQLPRGTETIGGGLVGALIQRWLGPVYRSPAIQHAVISTDYFIVHW